MYFYLKNVTRKKHILLLFIAHIIFHLACEIVEITIALQLHNVPCYIFWASKSLLVGLYPLS